MRERVLSDGGGSCGGALMQGRVKLNTSVAPETRRWLSEEALERERPVGRMIDELACTKREVKDLEIRLRSHQQLVAKLYGQVMNRGFEFAPHEEVMIGLALDVAANGEFWGSVGAKMRVVHRSRECHRLFGRTKPLTKAQVDARRLPVCAVCGGGS